MGRGEKLNKEKDSHFNDNDIIKSENSFESAFMTKDQSLNLLFRRKKLKSGMSFSLLFLH